MHANGKGIIFNIYFPGYEMTHHSHCLVRISGRLQQLSQVVLPESFHNLVAKNDKRGVLHV